MMKRFLALMIALATMLSLAACGGTPAEETPPPQPAEESLPGPDEVNLEELAANYDGEIYVEIWGKDAVKEDDPFSRGSLYAQMAKDFSARYDNVTVEFIYQGGYKDVAEKIMAAAAANTLPTIFSTEEAMVKGFENIAADMHDYMPSATIKDYMPGLLVSMQGKNGELLGAPSSRSLPVLYVNKELLAEAGWNGADIKTTEDMFRCAKDVYEKTGAYGLINFWDTDAWHWESAVYADGGAILNEDGSAPVFGAEYDYVGATYLNQIKEGLMEGYVVSPYGTPEPQDTRDDMFCSGEAAMMITACNSMPKRASKLEEAGYTLETYIQPAGLNGDIAMASGGSNWVICDAASYEQKMFAGAFLAYVAEVEQVMSVNINTGSMLITQSAFESEAGQATLTDYPYTQSIYESVPYLHTRPNTPFWIEMQVYAVDKLEQFSMHPEETDVESMIDDISTKFQQIIDDNTW